MAKHIGIVACSAEGAALCYTTVCTEAPALMGKKHAHPEVSMHTHPFSDYVRLLEAGNWDGVAALMLSSEAKLAKAGAELVICPDNTVHQVFDQVVAKSKLPWLHIAGEVAREASRRGYKKVGLIGTAYTMEASFYNEKFAEVGIGVELPEEKDRKLINRIIFDELVAAQFTAESRAYFTGLISEMRVVGCEAVVLGCTEVPLIITEENSPLPVLDSTRLLARAALRASLE
ncbi:MAG: amino acid racemase [Candidatus Krumholzibacteria bacterium]|nr:amino acid racemase [Candidatus Krumholzibacteria bacterium]MDH4338081.1 amino acid racemase [Candidatus Krumholzibacteria bacterium]MDH5270936.1 amino acid racemase [Candidatus Krumholzibacteria bacterium]